MVLTVKDFGKFRQGLEDSGLIVDLFLNKTGVNNGPNGYINKNLIVLNCYIYLGEWLRCTLSVCIKWGRPIRGDTRRRSIGPVVANCIICVVSQLTMVFPLYCCFMILCSWRSWIWMYYAHLWLVTRVFSMLVWKNSWRWLLFTCLVRSQACLLWLGPVHVDGAEYSSQAARVCLEKYCFGLSVDVERTWEKLSLFLWSWDDCMCLGATGRPLGCDYIWDLNLLHCPDCMLPQSLKSHL